MIFDPTYPPINTLKAVTEDDWTVDGSSIGFGLGPLRMLFSTRMTILRVGGRDLLVHSPTALPYSLRSELAGIGTPRWLVAPNRIHYWWVPDWHGAYPTADVFVAPGVRQRAGHRIDFPTVELDAARGWPWDEAVLTLPVHGRWMTEVVLFHRSSRTLILTDLVASLEPDKIASPFYRWLARVGGVMAPNARTPFDIRLHYARAELKQAVETMLSWQPERVIFAHGRWYRSNGAVELRRAFHWLV